MPWEVGEWMQNPSDLAYARRMNRFACLLAVLGAALICASSAESAASPPPLGIDLNAFDAMKKSETLPNGEVLAYIEMGDASGPAVVLIHGYTDSARDWVPLVPYLSKRARLILVDIRGHGA